MPNGFVFTAADSSVGRELWFCNGTAAGTSLVLDIVPGSGSGVGLYPVGDHGGITYFNGTTAASGAALWQTDGTVAGTHMVDEIVPGTDSAAVYGLGKFGSTLLLAVTTPALGTEPWVFDAAGMSGGKGKGSAGESDAGCSTGANRAWWLTLLLLLAALRLVRRRELG